MEMGALVGGELGGISSGLMMGGHVWNNCQ
jgi:hypothetical protein